MGIKFNPFTANFDLIGPPPGTATWGDITGTIDDQVDLNDKFSDYINRSGAYYLTSAASDMGGGRLEMITTIPPGGGFGISNSAVADGTMLANFCSVNGYPNVTSIPSGVMSFRVQAIQTGGTKTSRLYVEFYTRTNPGGVDTVIATSALSAVLTGVSQEIGADVVTSVINNLALTDRLGVRIIADVSGAGTDPDITINIQGATFSRVSTPLISNSLTSVAWGDITGTLSDQTDLQSALDAKQDLLPSGADGQLFYQQSFGVISTTQNLAINVHGGLDENITLEPDNDGYSSLNYRGISIEPLQDSPSQQYALVLNNINFDPNSSGFGLGTSGAAFSYISNNFAHAGTGNLGSLSFTQNSFDIGNGTDPIEFNGFGYNFGFGIIRDNVTVNGTLQGYGFQPAGEAGVIFDTNANINAFYDYSNFIGSINNYTAYATGPIIGNINNNSSYVGMSINPNITSFTGDSGATGINITGTYGDVGNYGFTGININPDITSTNYTVGLNITMDNVTPTPGAVSTLTVQDITYDFNDVGDNNYYTLTYTPGATAGSEVVSILGNDITIQIEDGVSTATQIKAAADASALATAITTTISGTAGNAQTIFGPSNFVDGEFPGTITAAYLDGDVEITGSLTFGGSLSIGQLNAFYQTSVIDGGGNPQSVNNIVTALTMPASTTTANIDTIGTNTTMLISMEANSVNTSGPFKLGAAAIGLPIVAETHTGSSLDFLNMGLYALNLSGSSTGGTIDRVNGARVEAIPNGITTVNEFVAFEFDQLFGQVGTTVWGLHIVPTYAENFLGGSLKIGGSDVVSNSSVALEIESTTKAFLNARMTTTERDALTAINGMQIYNLTDDKLQVYAAGAWVDLH